MALYQQSIQAGKKESVALSLGLAFVLLLGGCSFAPGMHVQSSLWGKHGPDVIPAPGIADADIKNFIEITPVTDEVIDALAQATEVQSSAIPGELVASASTHPYQVGVNDVLSIVVWGQPELVASGGQGGLPLVARQVKSDGSIFFPYAGTLNVLGKTRQQIRQQLTKKLSNYFQDPQIDVSIEQYNSQKVVLSGAFEEPTTIPLQGVPLTLDQAIALARGVTPEADTRNLQIVRNGRLYSLNYHRLAANGALSQIVLAHGDAVYLPINQSKAYIVGEVGQPQKLTIQAEGLTLTDALGSAGGLSPSTSDGDQVYVIRGMDNTQQKPQVFRLAAHSPAAFILAGRFHIQPQDVIFVGASGLTRWNRVISQIFPSTNLLRLRDSL